MKWHSMICRSRNPRTFTKADCTESDLVQYSVDHLEAAEELYKLSSRWRWQYLHSAGYLSHLGVELLLKACLLHFDGEFPAEHDLRRLFRRLRRGGVRLSEQSRRWLSHLNRCNELRYPDTGTGPDVDVNHWKRTDALFEELRNQIPEEIRKEIISHKRYRANVKSGKAIWPEIKKPNKLTGGDSQ
jgi:HEPN domain-containing protein